MPLAEVKSSVRTVAKYHGPVKTDFENHLGCNSDLFGGKMDRPGISF